MKWPKGEGKGEREGKARDKGRGSGGVDTAWPDL